MEKIIPPRRPDDWFFNGSLTRRAIRFFEDMSGVTNDTAETVDDADQPSILSASVIDIQNRIGSGIPITIDTSGFTIDTSMQFTDQSEA
jgi:hypothetical protein